MAVRLPTPDNALRVAVQYTERCTHDYHDGENYGRWERSYDYTIDRVRAVPESKTESYNEEIYAVPADTKQVYVVYMIYSTGDSFGNSDGEGQIMWVFADRDKAWKLRDQIENSVDEYSIVFKDDFDRDVTVRNPAAGYFESMLSINVEAFVV